MDWFPIVYGICFGAGIGIAMVEYSRWRMKRMITSMVNDFLKKVREDGETERRIKEMVDKVVDYAIDHIKKRLSEGSSSPPPALEAYLKKKDDF